MFVCKKGILCVDPYHSRILGFILPKVSDIEGEIDLWTQEIEKNSEVIRAESYEQILQRVQER